MWRLVEAGGLLCLEPLWEQALRASPASIFQSFAFARWWAQAFSGEAEVRVWVEESASLQGAPLIVPLALRGSQLTLLGEGLFDYPGLVGVGDERRLAEAAELACREPWNRLCVTGVPAAAADSDPGSTGCRLPLARFWRGLGATAVPFAAAPRRLPGGGATALEREHPNAARRWRRAVKEGCILLRQSGLTSRLAALDWILIRKDRRCRERGEDNVLGPREQRWLRSIVEHEPRLAELWTLEDGGGRLGALLCWRGAGVRYAYTIAWNPRDAGRSPGILLLFGVLRFTMEEGLIFDFLTGEQEFKLRFATRRQPLLRFRGQRACDAPIPRNATCQPGSAHRTA